MGGGILQLVAKGMEDLFISGDPEITLFKIVYRKHTYFSLEDKVLKFNSRPGFGRESICKIRKWGDLLHKSYLMIDLPAIDLFFTVLTRQAAVTLLSEFGITWTITDNFNNAITDEDIVEITQLIADKITELEETIARANNSLTILMDPGLDPTLQPALSLTTDEYFDLLIETLITEDTLEFIYAFTSAWKSDYVFGTVGAVNDPLVNSTDLHDDLFTRYRNQIILPDVTRAIDESYIFISELEFANLSLSLNEIGVNAFTYFQGKIDIIYESDIAKDYQKTDAYKLFVDYFNRNTIILNNNTDVSDTQANVISHIKTNLIRIPELLNQVFETMATEFNFLIYKIYEPSGTTFSTSGNFTNLSLNNPETGVLNDNFTNNFSVTQSGDPVNPYDIYVQSFISPLHTTNQTLWRTNTLQDYFDDIINTITIWDAVKISNLVSTKTATIDAGDLALIENTYFLNCLPFVVAIDIPEAVDNYIDDVLVTGDVQYTTFKADMLTAMEARRDSLHTEIQDFMLTTGDVEKLVEYNTSVSEAANRDIVGFHNYQKHFISGSTTYTMLEYIVKELEETVVATIANYNAVTAPGGGLPTVSIDDENILISIVNLFITDINSLPSFAQYALNGYTLLNTTISPNPFSSSGPPKYVDAISSIWYYLYKTMNTNYNNFYNNEVLLNSYFLDTLGQDIDRIKELTETNFALWMNPPAIGTDDINYYQANSINPFNLVIGTPALLASDTIDPEIIIINDYSSRYEDNKLLLNMKNITVPRQTYFFEFFSGTRTNPPVGVAEVGMHNFIESEIRDNPTTYGVNFPISNLVSDIINDTQDELDAIPTFGVMDKYDREIGQQAPHLNYQQAFDEFFTASPGYNAGGELDALHALRSPNVGTSTQDVVRVDEEAKFISSSGSFINSTLFNDITNISNNYDLFSDELNFVNYLLDTVLNKSTLSPLLTQKGITNQETYDNFVTFFENLRDTSQTSKDNITGNPPQDPPELLTLINLRRQSGQRASFAWIQKVGLFMIDYVSIHINNQLIDRQTGEFMFLWHELSRRSEKERGYNEMIGHLERFYRFDSAGKKTFRMFIPLEFWFCRHIGGSIPLIALTHSEVEIKVRFKELAKCAYWDSGTTFNPAPRLDCAVLAQYIYVEPEERGKIVRSKHEYLIETIQYDTSFDIEPNVFADDETRLMKRYYFKYPCKELIWAIRETNLIDGSLENGELRYNEFTNRLTDVYPDHVYFGLRFNGRDRQLDLQTEVYNMLIPYSYHTSVPGDGIFNYCFSQIPELLQPSGSANLSKVDNIDIILEISDDLRTDIIENNRVFQWSTYTRNYNVLRIMSGLAALAYFE